MLAIIFWGLCGWAFFKMWEELISAINGTHKDNPKNQDLYVRPVIDYQAIIQSTIDDYDKLSEEEKLEFRRMRNNQKINEMKRDFDK